MPVAPGTPNIKEAPQRTSSPVAQSDGTFTWTARRVFTAAYYADVNDVLVDLAAFSPGPVSINAQHPNTPLLYCNGPQVTQDGPNFFKVTADYSLLPKSDGTNPLLAPPKLYWEFGANFDHVDTDYAGNAITNSAGIPFGGAFTKESPVVEFVVVRNEPFYDPHKNLMYQGFVNSDNFSPFGMFTLEPGRAKCIYIKPAEGYFRNAPYIPISYRFRFIAGTGQTDSDGLNDGFRQFATDRGTSGWFNPDSGPAQPGELFSGVNYQNRVSTPVLLDGSGKPMLAGYKVGAQYSARTAVNNPASPIIPSSVLVSKNSQAVTLKFRTFLTIPFAGIGL